MSLSNVSNANGHGITHFSDVFDRLGLGALVMGNTGTVQFEISVQSYSGENN